MSKKLQRAAASFMKSFHSRLTPKRQAEIENLLGKGVMGKISKLQDAANEAATATPAVAAKTSVKRGRPAKS